MALSDIDEVSFKNTSIVREETPGVFGLEIAQVDKVICDFLSVEEKEGYLGSVYLSTIGRADAVVIDANDIPKVIEYLHGVLKEYNETKN